MAIAKITSPEGISVEIDGAPDEVTEVVEQLRAKFTGANVGTTKRRDPGKVQIPDLVSALKAENFFRAPRGLGDIQRKLGDLGHHYPLTTLSGAMQAEVRKRTLRRFKEKGKYVYVQ